MWTRKYDCKPTGLLNTQLHIPLQTLKTQPLLLTIHYFLVQFVIIHHKYLSSDMKLYNNIWMTKKLSKWQYWTLH